MTAGRSYVGCEAVYHKQFAGNCLENREDRCFDNGIGPKVFDCSGFILRAYCDVTGEDIVRFGDVRHVREMWTAAQKQKHPFVAGELAAGSLIVTRRRYHIDGQSVFVPGHIGIITNAEHPSFIHASAESGRVEERPIKSFSTMLGYIAIKG